MNKHTNHRGLTAFFVLLLINCFYCRAQTTAISDKGMQQLLKHGNITQLYVDEKPFLILGGQLNNSTSSSIADMEAG
jgi:hypothetical protein